MHLYTVSGILLIVPIFAFAAPVLVQEKRQECADMSAMTADIPEYSITVLGKRGNMFGEIEEVGGKHIENWFVPPEKSSAAHVSPGAAPSEPDHVPISDVNAPAPSEPGHVSTSGANAPAPNPGPSTGSDHWLAGMNGPVSSPVHPGWFHPDNKLLGPNAEPNPTIEFGSDHKLVEEPPSRPASPTAPNADHEYEMVHPPTQSEFEMVNVPPSSPVSSTNLGRRWMDARLENVRDALKGNAKESRRISSG
jgi:hypothetical protein